MVDKLLAEWFWTDRWMGSSAWLLPLEPRGLYREMLTQAWRRGCRLPNDPVAIQRATGVTAEEWSRCWPLVSRYWREDDAGDLVNDTQIEVYAEACRAATASQNRATKAARARWGAGAQVYAQASPQALLEQCPPSPSPSPSPTDNNGNPPDPPAGAGGNPHVKAPGARSVDGQVERLVAHARAKDVPLSPEAVRRMRRELKAGRPEESLTSAIDAQAEAFAASEAHQQSIRDAHAWILDRGGLDAAVADLAAWLSTQQRPGEPMRAAVDRWQEGFSVPPYVRCILIPRLPRADARSHSPPAVVSA